MGLLSYQTTTRATGEFQNLNRWELSFSFPQTNIPDDIRFRCVSAELPQQEEEQLSITINRFELTQPSHVKRNGSITFTFTETTAGSKTHDLWDEITKLKFSMDDKDAQGLSKGWLNLKGTIIAYLLDSEGNRTQGFKLIDCDLRPKFEGSLGSDAEVLQPTLEVSYNWWAYLKQ